MTKTCLVSDRPEGQSQDDSIFRLRVLNKGTQMFSNIETVADGFYAAIERNDFVAVAALYGDDLKTWRSFDLVSQTKAEQLATLAAMNARWASHYGVIERHFIGDQLIQRHELTLTEKDGTVTHRLQAAAFLTIREGRVHVLDEYLDSRDVGRLMGDMKREPHRLADPK